MKKRKKKMKSEETKKKKKKLDDIKILLHEQKNGKKVVKHPKHIKNLADEIMYLDNLLNKYETKINETLKAKYDLSEIVKENKEMAKRAMMVFNERERSKKIQKKICWVYQSF